MSEHRTGARRSIWQGDAPIPEGPPLEGDVETDVCVIGGGLTGLTAALSIAREGRRVVLLERHRIGGGVTGSTTAHITSLVDGD
ncbi:MAG TPA: FAD-dependent oxidoreductase [Sandaracinaceae bacterium LLY-WYZ-13_1]|nr:FAD-dependent oxidoreductase [Sandaracinaceae bacterium LLY-WYZ-13_1]